MSNVTRRDLLEGLLPPVSRSSSAALPAIALAQGEVVVPFTDVPPPAPPAAGAPPPPCVSTPSELTNFIVVERCVLRRVALRHATVDPSTYKLRVTGLVERPLRVVAGRSEKRPRVELTVGFECSGNNNARGNPLVGNARWAGVALAPS